MAFMVGFSRVFYAERQKNLTTDERMLWSALIRVNLSRLAVDPP
jgi:hypothetical protein